MVDWGAGNYERTAAELEPVAEVVVEKAGLLAGEDVVDLACGTGNAALIAADRGARVIGIDSAPRLREVASERAKARGVSVEFRQGDLLDLPADDRSADVVLSVFGVIFASDPAAALREIARVLRSGGRLVITAWIPSGPIDATLGAMGRIVGRITQSPPPHRFAWSDPAALAPLANDVGLRLKPPPRPSWQSETARLRPTSPPVRSIQWVSPCGP